MIQRIQSIYMLLLILINIFIVISIDSNPEMSLSESYFGYFRPYIDDYFFTEILSMVILINIFLFKKSALQINILRLIFLILIFGLLNLFDERSLESSFTDPGLIYFLVSFFLVFMSIRSIKKDQSIISSSNRLR
ncbi:MAG: DUF4293 family protein [Flavobacteriales bacterium]|nr:MAG: DUF4293 family protein [Flavobacteriales bacterium]